MKKLIKHGHILNFLHRISQSRLCLHKLFYCHTLFGLELDSFNQKYLSRRAKDITYEVVNQHDMNDEEFDHFVDILVTITEANAPNNLRDTFYSFFKLGHKCFVAKHSGEVVAYYWGFPDSYVVTYDNYQCKNIKLTVDDNGVFFGNGHIASNFRLKGVFPHLAKFCVDWYSPGTRFLTLTDYNNYQSLNSHIRIGYEAIFTLQCLSVGPLQFHMLKLKSGKRKYGFYCHFTLGQMPTFNIVILEDLLLNSYPDAAANN